MQKDTYKHNKEYSQTWVVVADGASAKIYHMKKFPKIELIADFEHKESRLQNQDLISAKSGKSSQSEGSGRYSYQPETEPKDLEAEKFAKFITEILSHRKEEECARLYLIASPSFLGLLRRHLSPETVKKIIAESPKDLTSSSVEAIEKHLADLSH